MAETEKVVRDFGPDFKVGAVCGVCGREIRPGDLFLSMSPVTSADGVEHPEIKTWYGGPENSVMGFLEAHGAGVLGILYHSSGDDPSLPERGTVLHRAPGTGVHGLGVGEAYCPGDLGRVAVEV